MAKDLRHSLDTLRRTHADELVRVSQPVDPDRGPAALLQRLECGGRSPVAWFDHVGDSSLPVVVNCHDTPRRLALAMGVDVGQLHEAYVQRLKQPVQPVHVDTGPVQQVVAEGLDVDLHVFIVADDVDATDAQQVRWAPATRFQGDCDLVVSSGQPGSSLDPSATDPSGAAELTFDCMWKHVNSPPANRTDLRIVEEMDPISDLEAAPDATG